ncbi:hypothetical protein [Streptomyces sp. NBC_01207]|uniref:hypothetical protein n=1 Tax=Streptomyces sp. NBC_01207 TaxID=2903772 RepID=UPI002E0D8386|nr:hypothetical protein OG457_30390 [Streptomyces sp. NBC_01207]
MPRFVLYYKDGRDAPATDLRRIKRSQAAVLAAAADTVLVEARKQDVEQLVAGLKGWAFTAGSAVELPVASGKARATQ